SATPDGRLPRGNENRHTAGPPPGAIPTELAPRLMTIEARTRHGWTSGKVLQRLKQNPHIVQTLTNSEAAVASINGSRVHIFPVDSALVVAAAAVSRQTGLLSNGALMVAVMQANGLTKRASNDADLDRVPGLTRYAPA